MRKTFRYRLYPPSNSSASSLNSCRSVVGCTITCSPNARAHGSKGRSRCASTINRRPYSRRIMNAFDFIAVEGLAVKRMTHHHHLAKSMHDVAWSQFASLLASKAARAGRTCMAVIPAYASQDRSQCGHRQPLTLSERISTCPCCGLVLDRDLNATRPIVSVGQRALASAEKLPDVCGGVVTKDSVSFGISPTPGGNEQCDVIQLS
jgi:putative transposase